MSEVKVCNRCGDFKLLVHFSVDKSAKDGLCRECKVCRNTYRRNNRVANGYSYEKKYRELNKEKIKLTQKKYRDKNKQKIKEYRNARREQNIENSRAYRLRHLEELRRKGREYSKTEKATIVRKRYRSKLEVKERIKTYREKAKPLRYAKIKQRISIDKEYAFTLSIRRRLSSWLSYAGKCKHSSSDHYFGCSKTELRKHLENQFSEGMTWQNYGLWHVDHIKPLWFCSLEGLTPEQSWHFSNLRPLWAKDNISRPRKIEGLIKEGVVMADTIKNIQTSCKVSEEKWNKIFKEKPLPNKKEEPKKEEQPSK